ncbi:MAG: hypothetical protein KC657_14765 [Myxococcales bacterium]|nr:hypothetical protein [Myxococcales bacterium]
MKHTMIPLVLTILVACGDQEASAPVVTPPPTDTPAPAPPAAPGAPVRTLVTKRAVSTHPHNLVVDPEMQSLWTPLDESGFGIYEAFVQDGERDVRFVAETPTGPGGAVLTMRPTAGGEATLTMTVQGGKGPLSARVWVAAPADGRAPEVQLASLYDGRAIFLDPVQGSERAIDGVRWVELRGATTEDMPGVLYLVAVSRGAGETRVHAPEVLTDAIPKIAKGAAPARTTLGRASARTLGAARRFSALRAAHVTMSAPPRPHVPGSPRGL